MIPIPRRSVYRVVLPALFILSIPLIAMQFTNEVDWSAGDFIVMGVLVLVFGTIMEFARLRWKSKRYLASIVIIIVLLFLFLWIEMAVGIIGSPIAGS
jgi:asparagine N-glycosylation enzyme membrane subunit Stt3